MLPSAAPSHLQSGALSVEHAGFYTELYAALKHAMLVPLLDGSWQGSAGGNDAAASAEEQEEADLLNSALAADDLVDTKIGGQVGAAWVHVGLSQAFRSLSLLSRPIKVESHFGLRACRCATCCPRSCPRCCWNPGH